MKKPDSTIVRYLYIGAGSFFVALGILGAFLPVLPTTPFLLIAAACYARSSERLYRRLLDHPIVGPPIERWRTERTVSREVKRIAIVTIVISFSITIVFFLEATWLRASLVLVATAIVAYLARLPTERAPSKEEHVKG